MIIGISGKKGSGKDTVAKIIQYFTLPKESRTITLQEWVTEITYHSDIDGLSKFIEIRKFADKLKDCVSLILNIPRWRLELEEVKEQVLPECWSRWVLYTEFNESIYATKQEALDVIKALKLAKNEYELYYQPITVRLFLQWLGTEAARYAIHPDIWVNALFAEYGIFDIMHTAKLNSNDVKIKQIPVYPSWLITDVRFPNEANIIKNGTVGYPVDETNDFRYLIRVDRPDSLKNTEVEDEHESETALDDYEDWDEVIINDCSFEELGFKIHTMLKSNPIFENYFYL